MSFEKKFLGVILLCILLSSCENNSGEKVYDKVEKMHQQIAAESLVIFVSTI